MNNTIAVLKVIENPIHISQVGVIMAVGSTMILS